MKRKLLFISCLVATGLPLSVLATPDCPGCGPTPIPPPTPVSPDFNFKFVFEGNLTGTGLFAFDMVPGGGWCTDWACKSFSTNDFIYWGDSMRPVNGPAIEFKIGDNRWVSGTDVGGAERFWRDFEEGLTSEWYWNEDGVIEEYYGVAIAEMTGRIAPNGLYEWVITDNIPDADPTAFLKFINEEGKILAFDRPDVNGTDPATYSVEGEGSGTYYATMSDGNGGGLGPQTLLPAIVAGDPNLSATAKVVADACVSGRATGQFQNDCDNLAAGAVLDPAGTARALNQITIEEATAPVSSSRASMGAQRQNLSSRLVAVRSGATGLSFAGLMLDQGLTADASYPMIGGAASADGTILQNERFGVFVNGNFSKGDRSRTINEPGYDFDSYSLTAGVDYRFLDDLVAGLGLGFNSGRTDFANSGGRLDVDGYSLSLFASYFPDEAFYVDGILTWGRNDYDQKRNIRYSLLGANYNQTASADYSGDYWSGSLGAGYNIAMGSATITPLARLDYTSASVDGYTETMSNPLANGAGWATRMDKLDQDSFNSYIGVSLSNAFSTSEGVLVPKLEIGWVHEFKDSAPSVNGGFVQDPTGGTFMIQGDKRDSDYYIGTVGMSAQFAGGVAGYVQFSKVFGYRDLSAHNIGAGVRVSF